VPDPENGNVQVTIRRRRTHRHRRNRMIRRWLAAMVIAVFAGSVSTVALRYFSPSWFSSGPASPIIVARGGFSAPHTDAIDQILSRSAPSRTVYPYSVVPGGVEDAKELKWVAEHDPIVAAHYAGFDYDHARVVRLTLARTVYLSYRIGNHIYWTRRRVTLHQGEKVITDGRMTARSRCANRVEEAPQQQAASPVEPPVEKFDEPMRAGNGTALQSPTVPFESALLNRPQVPGFDPAGPLSLYDPFVGGSFVPISPAPFPLSVCSPAKKKGTSGEVEPVSGKKKKTGPCGTAGGTEVVPEPGTWIMFISGLIAISWQARRRFARA